MSADSTMDLETILRLLDAVTERGISRLEVESNGTRLKIERPAVVEGRPEPAPQVVLQPAVPKQVVPESVTLPAEEDPDLHTMRSPMVGTYYSAPSPASEAYVRVGDRVKKGQVLCIVEAMKLMNEIESDVSGTIESILVENAQPVEYGEELFRIRLN